MKTNKKSPWEKNFLQADVISIPKNSTSTTALKQAKPAPVKGKGVIFFRVVVAVVLVAIAIVSIFGGGFERFEGGKALFLSIIIVGFLIFLGWAAFSGKLEDSPDLTEEYMKQQFFQEMVRPSSLYSDVPGNKYY